MKKFLKNFISKFCLDKKFNNICLSVIELPLIIFCLISKHYNLLIWGVIGLAIINAIIKKVYISILMKKSKNLFNNIIVDNINKKEDEQ